MAWEKELFCQTFDQGADLRSNQFRFVKLNNLGQVVPIAAATDKPLGIQQDVPEGPEAGLSVSIAFWGISKIQADAALSAGAQIGTSADGQAAAYVPGNAPTNYIVGDVLEGTGAAGGLATTAFNCIAAGRGA